MPHEPTSNDPKIKASEQQESLRGPAQDHPSGPSSATASVNSSPKSNLKIARRSFFALLAALFIKPKVNPSVVFINDQAMWQSSGADFYPIGETWDGRRWTAVNSTLFYSHTLTGRAQ